MKKSDLLIYLLSIGINAVFLWFFFSGIKVNESHNLVKKVEVSLINTSVKTSSRTSRAKRLYPIKKPKVTERKIKSFKKKTALRHRKNKLTKKETTEKFKRPFKRSTKVLTNKLPLRKAKKTVFTKRVTTIKKAVKKVNKGREVKKVFKRTKVALKKEEGQVLRKKIESLKKKKWLREQILREFKFLSASKTGSKSGSSGKASNAHSGAYGSSTLSPIYWELVKSKLQNNFSIPIYLKSQKGLNAVVKVIVSASGKIIKYEFLKKSPVKEFNDAIEMCLKLSQPLPVNKKAVIIIEFNGETLNFR